MTPDLDIYRAARLLIDQHGDKTRIHTSMGSDALLEAVEEVRRR